VHSAFGVFGGHSSKGKYLSSLSPVNPLYSVIARADVIIIDEMSMLSSDLMGVVLYRIKTCCGFRSIDEVYKKKLIILVGDHCQLPPVCNHQTSSTEFCSLCHLSSHPVWNVAEKHVLRHSVRHAADRKLSKFLDIIRVRQPTQEEIDACFSYPGAQVTLEQVWLDVMTTELRWFCWRGSAAPVDVL
jgi:ATP-dependent exoDNAse (exonuclease V) alpha subunit